MKNLMHYHTLIDNLPLFDLPSDDTIDPIPTHVYFLFHGDKMSQAKCNKLRKMKSGEHTGIDWMFLEEIVEADRARAIIGFKTLWARLFEATTRPSFSKFTVKFYIHSFFSVDFPVLSRTQPNHFAIYLFTLPGFLVRSLFKSLLSIRGCTIWRSRTPQFTLRGSESCPASLSSVSDVYCLHALHSVPRQGGRNHSPVHRYFKHIITSSNSKWGFSKDKVNPSDIFFLYCLLLCRPCALATCLAEYFESAHHRQTREQFLGSA